MKSIWLTVLSLSAATAFAATGSNTTVTTTTVTPSKNQTTKAANVQGDSSSLKTKEDKISYALGAALGGNMKKSGVKIDSTLFVKGFIDSYEGHPTLMNAQQIKSTMMLFQQQMIKKAVAKRKKVSTSNLSAGQAFLKSNKTKPGVISLPDGLQYKVVKTGSGAKPNKGDVVVVNYEGKTIDGKVFDSSYKRGTPATFKVSDVIRGWQEVLQLMPIGSTWEVYVPANLAYGAQGIPGHIAPNSTLIFKIDLIAIKQSQTKSK